MTSIALSQIRRNPDQPRKKFDEGKLNELAESIRKRGLLQPIKVRPIPPEGKIKYEIIMGERRFRAHRILKKRSIRCEVEKASRKKMQLNAIVENIERADMTIFEEAQAYQDAMDEFGLTPEKLAHELGIAQPHRITDRTKLLGLDEQYRHLVATGQLTASAALAMATLPPQDQSTFALVAQDGMARDWATATRLRDAIAAGSTAGPAPDVSREVNPGATSARHLDLAVDGAAREIGRILVDGSYSFNGTCDPGLIGTALEKLTLLEKTLKHIRSEGEVAMALSRAAAAQEADQIFAEAGNG